MTRIENTRYIIDGFRMNNMRLNEEYLIHNIMVTCLNERPLYNLLIGAKATEKKALSIAKNYICSWCNIELKCYGYKTVCTYQQIRTICGDQLSAIENGVMTEVLAEIKELNK